MTAGFNAEEQGVICEASWKFTPQQFEYDHPQFTNLVLDRKQSPKLQARNLGCIYQPCTQIVAPKLALRDLGVLLQPRHLERHSDGVCVSSLLASGFKSSILNPKP